MPAFLGTFAFLEVVKSAKPQEVILHHVTLIKTVSLLKEVFRHNVAYLEQFIY